MNYCYVLFCTIFNLSKIEISAGTEKVQNKDVCQETDTIPSTSITSNADKSVIEENIFVSNKGTTFDTSNDRFTVLCTEIVDTKEKVADNAENS